MPERQSFAAGLVLNTLVYSILCLGAQCAFAVMAPPTAKFSVWVSGSLAPAWLSGALALVLLGTWCLLTFKRSAIAGGSIAPLLGLVFVVVETPFLYSLKDFASIEWTPFSIGVFSGYVLLGCLLLVSAVLSLRPHIRDELVRKQRAERKYRP
jgi:hypothetical protein